MNTREEINTIRDKYTDMYNVGAYTNPTDYAVFLESEILALKIELNKSNDTYTRTEPALPIQNVSDSALNEAFKNGYKAAIDNLNACYKDIFD